MTDRIPPHLQDRAIDLITDMAVILLDVRDGRSPDGAHRPIQDVISDATRLLRELGVSDEQLDLDDRSGLDHMLSNRLVGVWS